jgi:hypothetical protein
MRKPIGKGRPGPDVRPQLLQALDLDAAGKVDEAERLYRAVLELDPANFAALNRLAIFRSDRGEHAEALRLIQAAMRSNPSSGTTASDMGVILERMGRLDEAKDSYDRALVLQPDQKVAHNGRGLALAAKGRIREAIAAFTRAIEFDPGYADARFHRSLALLLVGDFATGWDEYEWRWEVGDAKNARPIFLMPDWNGEPLAGKGIYLYIEQGFGDAIMFARYAPLVAARGGTVLFCVRPPLKALLADMPGVFVGVPGDQGPRCDYMCPLLSLPRIFKTRQDTIPGDVPYIHARPERIEKWKLRIPHDGKLNVGLVWAGGRDYKADKVRTIGFERFAPLLGHPDVRYVSLHTELREEDAARMRAHPEIVHFGSEIADFAETAAIISQLDLVISVDTAVAHLAGAMAKPVWLLLPFMPDWRWLLGRDDSPWYPTARLFRQERSGDWSGVIARARAALAVEAQARR